MQRATFAVLGALSLAIACDACDGGCNRSRAPSPRADPSAGTRGAPTPDITPELEQKLHAALAAKGPDYVPRTKHKRADGSPKYTNRLILETSPYLLQHAHNPVNWFPWGDEAFAIAAATGRPVFLSVGYSTCHWCHVMEEESFEDEEIARFINEHYVPIKVDREERPDVDSVYMAAVNRLQGRGGWPMSVWLTPDRKPFFGGTYFPARDGDRGARKGFLTILKEQHDRFAESPDQVAEHASRIAQQIGESMGSRSGGEVVDASVVDRAVTFAARRYDPTWGGARGAPKFPSSFPVRLLLRRHRRTGDERALAMAVHTLEKMADGGMYDHVGGGFHRYSTDARWLVPHFEKMLYDNALLVRAYVEAFQITERTDFARVVRETLDYVLREMTAPSGAFYSATDADSIGPGGQREEGYYFTWTPAEVEQALGPDDARVVMAYFDVTERGSFEGRSILWTPKPADEVAGALGVDVHELLRTVEAAKPKLRKRRADRPPPLRDDKIQVSWNGLMISALARAGFVLGEPRYVRAAERASDHLLSRLRAGGRLHHSRTAGRTGGKAFLDDYAFFAAGLLDVFEATAGARWLREAIALMDQLEELHADRAHGGYFMAATDHEPLFAREKPAHDGPVPSGNSVAAMNHLRIHELTTDDRWRVRAETTLRAFADALATRPHALDEMLLAVDFYTDVPKEVAIVAPAGESVATAPAGAELVATLRRTFLPNAVVVIGDERALSGPLGAVVPWVKGKPAKDGKVRAYVCERRACDLPTSDPAVFARQIAEKSAGGSRPDGARR